MRVWIVGDNFGFPNGAGATARVHGIVRALASTGAELRVFCLTPTETTGVATLNRDASGRHAGVAFEYACGTTTLPEGFLARRWLRVRSASRMLRAALAARRAGRAPDVVLATAQTLSGLALAALTARQAGARCVLDACELPSGFVRAGPRRRLHRAIASRLARRLAGVLCVSTRLEQHYRAIGAAATLRLPILVDVAAFSPSAAPSGERRIVYAGNLAHRDEIALLLEAFARVANDDPSIRLQVLGDEPGSDARAQLGARAAALGLGERVELPGAVDRATAAAAIAGAAALALPRPRTPWSEAGLSAKLADYLATGRPIVVTAIGDIPLYLEDGVSAFVVPPGDPEAFAAGLRRALGDPAEAAAVGAAGRAVALRCFDVGVHGPRLVRFFESLA